MNSKAPRPTVDVIIPAYNVAPFIGETLDSVLAQTFLPHKIIVVNDGSTDNTLQVVKDRKSPLIELISQENKGVSHARNVGIRASRADYIAFLDADDLWLPEKLEAQMEVFMRKPETKGVYSYATFFRSKGERVNPESYWNFPYPKGKMFDLLFQERKILSGSASSVAVEREFLCETSLFDENLSFAEDYDLWLQLAAQQEFALVPCNHVCIRQHPNSISRSLTCEQGKKMVLDHFYVINKYAETQTLSFKRMAWDFFALLRCCISSCHSLKEVLALARYVRNRAPHYWNKLFISFFFKGFLFYLFFFPFVYLRPLDRLILLLQEGTISFKNSKNPKWLK